MELDELVLMVSDEVEAGVEDVVEVAPIEMEVDEGMLSEDGEGSAMIVEMREEKDDEEEAGDEDKEEKVLVDEDACLDVDADADVNAVSVDDRLEVEVAVELTLTVAGLAY